MPRYLAHADTTCGLLPQGHDALLDAPLGALGPLGSTRSTARELRRAGWRSLKSMVATRPSARVRHCRRSTRGRSAKDLHIRTPPLA